MKASFTISLSLIMVLGLTVTGVQAEKARGGKGHQQRMADDAQAAAIQQNRLANAARAAQHGQGRMMRNGMMQQGAGNAQQLAQMMLANFDQNGDGTLNQSELESALVALMQQMQAAQQMAGGQAFAAAGGQGNCQGGNAAVVAQARMQVRNGQMATGQGGAQRFTSAGGGHGKGGGARRGR